MTCEPAVPDLPPKIQLKATDCLPDPPDGFSPFRPACISELDIDPAKLKAGGRSLVVVPYDTDVCSGEKGKFQVVSGFGGQICDAIYLGNTVGRRQTTAEKNKLPLHGVGLFQDTEFTDEPDCMLRDPDVQGGPKGDKGMAVRDRGQWYVVKLAGEGGGPVTPPGFFPASSRTPLAGQLTHFTTPGGPADWAALDLPLTYQHGDDFPNVEDLPIGIGWARLRYPSSSLAGRRGDVVNPNRMFGAETDLAAGQTLELLRAEVLSSGKILLWFSHNVELDGAPPGGYDWDDYFELTNLAAIPMGVSAAATGSKTNQIELTVSGVSNAQWDLIFEAGEVRLSVLTTDSPTKPRIIRSSGGEEQYFSTADFPCVYALDRAAYLLVMNRVHDGAIPLGSPLQVASNSSQLIADDLEANRRVYDFALGGAGGGAATPTFYPATVRTLMLEQRTHFTTPEGPENWTDFDLPVPYKHGQPFPEEKDLPDGIGWVRLRYPSGAIEGRRGDAVDEDRMYGGTADLPSGQLELVQAEVLSDNKILLWFSHNVELVPGAAWSYAWDDYFELTNLVTPTPIPMGVSAAATGSKTNQIELTVSGVSNAQWDLIFEAGEVRLSVVANALAIPAEQFAVQSSGAHNEPFLVSAFPCVYALDRAAYLLAMNRVYDSRIVPGSSVNVAIGSYIDLEDEQGTPNVRRVYDFNLGNAAAFERHLYFVIGGNAFTSIGIGAKYITTPLTSVPNMFSGIDINDPAHLEDLPDGLCILEHIETRERIFGYYETSFDFSSTDLQRGMMVFCPMEIRLPVAGTFPEEELVLRRVGTLI